MGFMLWFISRNVQYAIDATHSDHISRFINHSKKKANLKPTCVVDKTKKLMVMFKATKDIGIGEELLFDYGDERPSVLKQQPWLKF
jgi:histone-lysine N-methyltransferase SETD8